MADKKNASKVQVQNQKKEPSEKVIFRAFITLPNGKRLYAKACGCKAFPIKV